MTESANDSRSSLQELLACAHALLPMELRTVVEVGPLYRSLTAVWAQRPAAPLSLQAHGLDGDVLTNLFDHADQLVPDRTALLRSRSGVVRVQVTAAHARARDAHERVARQLNLGVGGGGHADVAGAVQVGGSHVLNPRLVRPVRGEITVVPGTASASHDAEHPPTETDHTLVVVK